MDKFSKYAYISNFVKIRPVGAELFHAYDRQIDMTKLAFRTFAKKPKNSLFCPDNAVLVSYRSHNKQRQVPL